MYTYINKSLFFTLFLLSTLTSSGQCWEVVMEAPLGEGYGYASIDFINENIGWISGTNHGGDTNFIAKTIDAGENWVFTFFPDPLLAGYEFAECCDILHFVDEEVGYGSFSTYGFHKTIDGGASWQHIDVLEEPEPGFGYKINALEFISRDTGWITIDTRGVYATNDGGETWEQRLEGFGGWNDIEFMNAQEGWAVDGGGVLYQFFNGGQNWDVALSSGTTNTDFNNIQFLNDNLGWVAGYSDKIYKTTDGGETWLGIEIPTENAFFIQDMEFVNDSVGWMCSKYTNEIQFTKDGGETWFIQQTPDVHEYNAMAMTSENEGWAISDDGFLLHYNPRPVCNELQAFYNIDITAPPSSGIGSATGLMPKIEWTHIYGCLDGYILKLRSNQDSTFYFEEDVGFTTSYQISTPLPDSLRISIEVIPYNYAYGSDYDCMGRSHFKTISCPPSSIPIDTFICEGENFYWDDYVFTEEGIYELPYLSEKDCDSTITLNLQYRPLLQTIIDTALLAGETLNGTPYTNDTLFTTLFSAVSGCDSIVIYVINIVTDINTPDEGVFWNLFPNPARNELFITSKYAWKEVVLYDIHGRSLRHWKGENPAGQRRLDVSDLDAGLYFVQIKGINGIGIRRVFIE